MSQSNAELVGTPNGVGVPLDDCPDATVRDGASTYAVGLPGKQATGSDLRYQVTITRLARDCTMIDGQIQARIGIQGRVIVGPAGAPPSVDVPIRIAVVQEGVPPKTIVSKFHRTNVAVGSQGNEGYSYVVEDVFYPAPSRAAGSTYVYYVGFDPEGLKVTPARSPKKGKKG